MKSKVDFFRQLGELVKQEFEAHNIIGLNDIISWKEGYDFQKTDAPFELYQAQIASRKPRYDDVNSKIHYLRSYLYNLSIQLNLKNPTAVHRIALCQFGLGLCGEQAHLAHFILNKICLNREIYLQSKIISLYSLENQYTHAFIVYGRDLSALNENFASLKNLDEATVVYDPTYKILSSAQDYANNSYLLTLCAYYNMNKITARNEDNLLNGTKKELAVIDEGVAMVLKHSLAGIKTSLANNKGDPNVLKAQKSFQIGIETRPSILTLRTAIEAPTLFISELVSKPIYPSFYLFHVKQSALNAAKWNEHREAHLTATFEYEPKSMEPVI